MKIVGILAILASALFSSTSFADAVGFKIQAWKNCETVNCELVQPKEWSTEEAAIVSKTLEKFETRGLSHLLTKIKKLGYGSLQRMTTWFIMDWNNSGVFGQVATNEIWGATFDKGQKTIALTDYFFSEEFLDPFSNESMQEIVLLHEIAHAYDKDGKLSGSRKFQKLAGFDYKDKNKGFAKADFETRLAFDDVLATLTDADSAARLSREFGMKYGVPRYYSMKTPTEGFADIVAYLYFDKNASSYMSKELIAYMDENVLKGARAK